MKLYFQILFLFVALFVYANAESAENEEESLFEYGKVEQESTRACTLRKGTCGNGRRCCSGLRCSCRGKFCRCS
uniref:U27-Deinotoxin-Dsu1b_2 n=1 Tax=Deinopis subrufa TaxID=1905329 RepID=A0A4V2H926_DEISU